MIETLTDMIRVTVVSVADGELYQVFECEPAQISAPWFAEMITDSVHPWRRFHVFVTPAGVDTSYGAL